MGHIIEALTSGYYATSWSNALKALTRCLALASSTGAALRGLAALITAAVSTMDPAWAPFSSAVRESTIPISQQLSPCSLAEQFLLTPSIRAVAEGYTPTANTVPVTMPEPPLPSTTPLSDFVFSLMSVTSNDEPMAEPLPSFATPPSAVASNLAPEADSVFSLL
jgi:hypothetical protein